MSKAINEGMFSNLKVYSSKDFPEYLPKLNSLYEDLFSNGKGFRSLLIQKVSQHLKLSKKQIHLMAQTIEFIHNASLLHDDLIDRSQLRRNKPAAWLKYTPEYAVLAGDYLLARVMVNLSRYGNIELLQYTAEMISDLLEGEWIQDSLVEDWSVSLNQLDQVHHLKTASLFKWCIKAPFIMKSTTNKFKLDLLSECGNIIGLLFQRSDDLLDYDIRNFENKAVLGDLKSGYLNSFGAFLIKGLSEDQLAQFKNCKSMNEVYSVLGKDVFNEKIESFDQLNQEVIDLYAHHINTLESELEEDEKGVIQELSQLPKLLYWRSQ